MDLHVLLLNTYVTYVDKTVPIEFPAKKKNTKAWHIYTTGSIYIYMY